MYALAGRLDPDRYLHLATAVYAEMALAGYTAVGEFHYLHHDPNGHAYADPNAMGHALIEAADRAGIRLTLLDTCYLAGGLTADGPPAARSRPDPVRRRHRRALARPLVAAAGHPEGQDRRRDPFRTRGAGPDLAAVAERDDRPAARPSQRTAGREPRHPGLLRLQPEPSCSPITACSARGRPRSTPRTSRRPTSICCPSTGTACCLCPTTERDLADGIGPARALLDAGSPLTLGSDQHAVIDPFEETARTGDARAADQPASAAGSPRSS